MYRRIEKLTIGIAAGLTLVTLGYAGLGPRLNEVPNPASFLGQYFMAPFIIMVCAWVGWHLAMRRKEPARLAEYRLLNSLPISSGKILLRFVYLDLLKYNWLLLIEIVVFFGVAQVAPLAHLLRLSTLTFFAYLTSIVINITMQIGFAIGQRHAGWQRFPIQYHPVISLAVVVSHAVLMVHAVTSSELSSGTAFWMILTVLNGIALVMFLLGERLFNSWREKNVAFAHSIQSDAMRQKTTPTLNGRLGRVLGKNPMLVKNVIKMGREKPSASILLTVAFAMPSYLIAMNNASISSKVTVLFALTLIYAFLFSYRAIAQTSNDQEPRELLYMLPISKAIFYFALFVPAGGVLLIVVTGLTLLLALSIGQIQAAMLFWLKSILAASVLLTVGLNFAVAGYPDVKRSQKYYLYWNLNAILLTALFYRFYWIVIALMVTFTFLPLRKIRFYELIRIASKLDHAVIR